MDSFKMISVRTSFYGEGAVENIGDVISARNLKRALIITDEFMYSSGLIDRIKGILINNGVEAGVYKGVLPNPTVDIVNEALKSARDFSADCLISVGGGSQIDTAKAVGIILANGGDVRDYEGVSKSKYRTVPIAVVNTTAGTGSEMTSFYVITDTKTHSKMVMTDTNCMVSIAINDPELMVSMPPSLTAFTGLDALTHAIEAVFSKKANPLSDKDGLWAITTISEFLPRAYKDGNDMEARTMMAYAASVAGVAFSNAGLGIVHSMAHALGGKYNLPHGMCNALLLPYVLEFNGQNKSTHLNFQKIAKALNIKGSNWFPPYRCMLETVEYIKKMCQTLGVPKRLSVLNVENHGFLELAKLAIEDTCTQTNPVDVTLEDIISIYRKAY